LVSQFPDRIGECGNGFAAGINVEESFDVFQIGQKGSAGLPEILASLDDFFELLLFVGQSVGRFL
jgi:hypothetical protein